ncbi:DUF3857 domain-containing protein [Mucilaginibacter sp. dw_454]|uniref:DUF3857 domain-containing protein n=1 Tax=Mucilaginibacter sp. dw_454 TaxID=2720079 RepID=UPI001BD69982|nr:DUF3857 domain-containing protein [Mucilaginibacter sp. dw_454]
MTNITKRLLLLLLFTTLFLNITHAQDFTYNNVSLAELNMPAYARDSSAHAVVLNEHGDAALVFVNNSNVRLVYTYHIKIKLFDNEGFDKGNVQVPLYIGKSEEEDITDIQGVTVYKDDAGRMQSAELTPAQIFTIKETTNHTLVKFTMPALHKGCVIEYKYTVTSPYFQNFHEWLFQSDIPKIKSVYETHIPGFWAFSALKVGALDFDKKEGTIDQECMNIFGSKADCSHFVYGMSNIPAFIVEDYMTSPRNFIAALRFELNEFTDPSNGAHNKIAKEWKDVDDILKHNDYFGGQIKHKDLLKERILPIIQGVTDSMDKAKKIYAYIQKSIKWNEADDFGTTGLRDALEKHTGNSGDVNLALVSALWSAGINAEPVLISTRAHGVINKFYPVITEFNYVIVRADIGNKTYLLDATDPLLSFGMLPLRCLNDQGRVMPINKPSYWMEIKAPSIQSSTTILNLTLTDNGKLTGTITRYSRGYQAYITRKAIKKFNSIDEYVEDLDNRWTKIKIKKADVTNVDSLDKPISEVYEVEIDAYKSLDHQKLSFNPFIFNKITTNPFKLKERSYSVDWGMPSEDRIILNLHLPEGYTIENPPKDEQFALPAAGGAFAVDYTESDNSFSLSHVTKFTKSVYGSLEYPYLKELYNKMILSEKTEMIFKKKI